METFCAINQGEEGGHHECLLGGLAFLGVEKVTSEDLH